MKKLISILLTVLCFVSFCTCIYAEHTHVYTQRTAYSYTSQGESAHLVTVTTAYVCSCGSSYGSQVIKTYSEPHSYVLMSSNEIDYGDYVLHINRYQCNYCYQHMREEYKTIPGVGPILPPRRIYYTK